MTAIMRNKLKLQAESELTKRHNECIWVYENSCYDNPAYCDGQPTKDYITFLEDYYEEAIRNRNELAKVYKEYYELRAEICKRLDVLESKPM